MPSIDPEWSANFTPPKPPRLRSSMLLCRPVNLVFYAPTDWLRLGQILSQNVSPCAQYYISIPPLAADKTKPRTAQPALIHALGPQFHVIYEFNLTGWRNNFVDIGKGTWYQAGVEWRKVIRDTAGFDAAGGDIWGLNELGSATRTHTGPQRENMREAMRGLYDGDGGPPIKGLVWTSGVGQSTADLTTYKGQLESWYEDGGFWGDVAKYVRFMSQEVYGDTMSWAVPGADLSTRRDSLIDYLEHIEILADVSPPPFAPTRDTLRTTDAPGGNAAWAWKSAFGYTWVPGPVMNAYVASQIYAFRNYQGRLSWRGDDSFGFAWSPTAAADRPPWVTPAEYTAQSADIVAQIARSIRGSETPSDPVGIGACGPDGTWCAADLDGAKFNPAWHIFWTWTQPVASDSAATVVEDTPTTVPLVASDADGDPLTYSIVTQPQHGTLDGDGAQRTYTPAPNYFGPDSFTFKVNDGVMDSRLATVSIIVTPVNDAPVVELAPAGPIDEGAAPLPLTATATDVENDPLTYTWTTSTGTVLPTADTATLAVDDGPAVAHVTVTADDGQGGTDTTAIDVVVRNVAPTVEAGADLSQLWRMPLKVWGTAGDPSTADAAAMAATWDFGDDTPPVTGLTPMHSYDHPGTYTATLTVTDKDGGTTTDTRTVTIGPRPAELYFGGPYTPTAPWATLSARIWDPTDRTGERLLGHRLTIHLGSKSCSANTNAGGLATCAINITGLPLGRTPVTITFPGDELYTADTSSSVIWLT